MQLISARESFSQLSRRLGDYGALLLTKRPGVFFADIELDKLLVGGEAGRCGAEYARLSGDLLRPSRRIAQSPHALLLKDYQAIGSEIFATKYFQETPYYKNAMKCIQLFGRYFAATDSEGIVRRAMKFCRMFDGRPFDTHELDENEPGSPVIVRRIRLSDCYEVINGHHRLAVAAVNGLEKYNCLIRRSVSVLTPVQQMIRDSTWTAGRCEIYQPVPAPEVATWPTVRRCIDRFEMMARWLAKAGIHSGSYLDVGCSYGWFVSKMLSHGFQAFGVDRDVAVLSLGRIIYDLDASTLRNDDIVTFLGQRNGQYDVVSCFSILHHFLLRGECSAADLIKKVDAITGRALFLDTAECHEEWFAKSLPDWNAEFITKWLREHTSFAHIEILGTDTDNVGRYRNQYRRHLFVCSR